ncbi:MAG: menaquinone-dependent protoporphyrinogen IX dehydrogenase [Gallionellaceae bacterium]|nr:menaquinone-dependent protoporphyrinogen IX dehydrogenase [Gallionellaceae bacterium]
MANILILYSTTDGHTLEICQQLMAINKQAHNKVSLVDLKEAEIIDLLPFDKIVIGASIRYGRHSPRVIKFIKINQRILESKPNAFFSVNVVARKPEKNTPETNPYLNKLLHKIDWRPKNLAVFAGKIDYPRYNFIDRLMIRFIMWLTNGPTHRDAVVDFTDWNKVDDFGRLIVRM